METKRILIVGGAGYIGGYLTDTLNHGHEITVYDNLTYEPRYLKDVDFVFGDVRDRSLLGNTLVDVQPDIVIWLAAIVGDGACQLNPSLTEEVNYQSVRWLCDNYDGKIIFTSTCSVYGINNELIDEHATPNPLSVYASTKLAAERHLRREAGDSLVFRLGTLYGLGDCHSRLRFDLVANILTNKAVNNTPLSVFGGEQWRPLLHVRDVTSAIVHGIDNNIAGLYNLHDNNYTIGDLARNIVEVVNPACTISYTDMSFEDLRNYRVTSDKYRQTGWLPQNSLDEGIAALAQTITEGRIKDPTESIYSNERFLKESYSG